MTEETFVHSELEIISSVDKLIDVETFLYAIFEDYNLDENHFGNILISVSEAVNNAIIHGNSQDESKRVKILCEGSSNDLQVVVQDEGPGFDHTTLPDPTAPENLEKETGRGIFIMTNLADEVEFENDGRIVKLNFSFS